MARGRGGSAALRIGVTTSRRDASQPGAKQGLRRGGGDG